MAMEKAKLKRLFSLKTHLWCFKCVVKWERGTENIFDRKLPLLPIHYFKHKQDLRLRDSKIYARFGYGGFCTMLAFGV